MTHRLNDASPILERLRASGPLRLGFKLNRGLLTPGDLPFKRGKTFVAVSYTHLTLPTIYSV